MRTIIIRFFILLGLLFPALATPLPMIQLPRTGQTACYDAAGSMISCAGTGQDGAIQAGAAWPAQRFADNGDQTVTDKLSGLQWSKDAGMPTVGSCTGGTKNWQQAFAYVACLNTANYLGHNDWRLPNVNEINSLVNVGVPNNSTWLISQGFINIPETTWESLYWSSTFYNRTGYVGWANSPRMWDGDALSSYMTSSFRVWPVRTAGTVPLTVQKTGVTTCYDPTGTGNVIACAGTGQDGELQSGVAWPNARFTDNGNQTATDQLTGLIWAKDAGTPTAGNCTGGAKTWQQSLDYVKCLNTNNYLGFNDWRLPNKIEMASTNDYSKELPALPTSHPFVNVGAAAYWYWASDSYILQGTPGAWYSWKAGSNAGDARLKSDSSLA